jgi:hypothetical protein
MGFVRVRSPRIFAPGAEENRWPITPLPDDPNGRRVAPRDQT